MAFADPQSVTINAVPYSLPRVFVTKPNLGTFATGDGLVQLSVSDQIGKRARRTIRLDHKKVAADPFVSGLNQSYSTSVYMVVDSPLTGYTIAEQKQIVDALVAYLTASSGARVTQLLGGEI